MKVNVFLEGKLSQYERPDITDTVRIVDSQDPHPINGEESQDETPV